MTSNRALAIGVVAFLFMGAMLISCGGSSTPEYTAGQELTLTGKMKIIDNDGEAYVIAIDNGEIFEVMGIEDKYKKEGVPIKAVVTVVQSRAIAVNGPSVKVKEYLEP
jgi:hypothetical protein